MIYAYPMDQTGCGHYRIMHPLKAMPPEAQAKVQLVAPGENGGIRARFHRQEVQEVDIPTDCTAVLVQRPTSEVMAKVLRIIRGQGIEIILEVDDDLEALDPSHPTWTMLRTLPGHDSIFPRLVGTLASRVVVSTEGLRERFSTIVQPGVEVLVCRNRIPRAQIKPTWEPEGAHVLGWPGAVITHPGDLDTLGGSIARLGRDFHIVGDKSDDDVTPRLGISDDRITYSGKIDFNSWVDALRDKLTVGVVPLKDSRFNRSKSALKALELAAAGVPMVRTTLPEFEQLGAGLGAEKSKHWFSLTRSLLEDPGLWNDEQERNREIALANTYEEHVDEWLYAWGLS